MININILKKRAKSMDRNIKTSTLYPKKPCCLFRIMLYWRMAPYKLEK